VSYLLIASPTMHPIQVPTKTVKELICFYYHWKKTKRYDEFLQKYGKISKKKMAIPSSYL